MSLPVLTPMIALKTKQTMKTIRVNKSHKSIHRPQTSRKQKQPRKGTKNIKHHDNSWTPHIKHETYTCSVKVTCHSNGANTCLTLLSYVQHTKNNYHPIWSDKHCKMLKKQKHTSMQESAPGVQEHHECLPASEFLPWKHCRSLEALSRPPSFPVHRSIALVSQWHLTANWTSSLWEVWAAAAPLETSPIHVPALWKGWLQQWFLRHLSSWSKAPLASQVQCIIVQGL